MAISSSDPVLLPPSAHVEETAPKARNPKEDSTAFEPQRRASSPVLKAWLAELTQSLLREEGRGAKPRARSRKDRDAALFALAVEVLSCNAIALMLSNEGKPMKVPRSSDAMWGGVARYRNEVYGRHLTTALDLMVSAGWLEELTLGYSYGGKAKGYSTYRPMPRFRDAVPSEAMTFSAMTYAPPVEVLVLKEPKDDSDNARRIDYEDTPETHRMRCELERLNARLQAAPIAVVDTDKPGYKPVDPLRRSLWRNFNNGSWQQGGRLFGGFWETMDRNQRLVHLELAGEAPALADYGQLFLRLAYAEKGLQAPLEDLYGGLGEAVERSTAKTLVNAMLFAKRPLRQPPKGLRARFSTKAFYQAAQAVLKRHEVIAEQFYSGIGFRLMFTESQILMDVLSRLEQLSILGLPLHDGLLVPNSRAEETKRVMEETFSDHCGGLSVPVAIKRREDS